MLTLFHAADLPTLATLACHLLAQPLADPLAAAQLLVPSRGMGRWLTLQMASEQGIAMHLDLQLPASLPGHLAKGLLDDPAQADRFAPSVLVWRIYDWLCQDDKLAQAPRLYHYLASGDTLRPLTLASKITTLFEQYALYRDPWLAAWEAGRRLDLGLDEDWQARLWQDLTQGHNARLWPQLMARLQQPGPLNGLPERLLAFGFSNLPPQHLALLEALGQHTEVVIFALNPCREAWGDIRSVTELASLGQASGEDWYLNVSNPLLASLGKQGRVFFDRLFASNAQETGIYDSDSQLRDHSLLAALHNDVLRLGQRLPEQRLAWQPDDRSLEVHSAHSPLREVQILHDQLLARFADDPSLKPDQVVVLTPDIERYAPFIESVFASNQQAKIPYSLADRQPQREFPLLDAFLALLGLPQSRFTAEDLMTLLEQPAIARRAGIAEQDLPLLYDWLGKAQIHWAWDDQHQDSLGLPANDTHSWQQGLDRLLLGFALPPGLAGTAPPLLAGLPPLDLVEGSKGQLLGRLYSFVSLLAGFAKDLQRPRPLTDWASTLQQLIDALIDEQRAGEVLLTLSRACASLAEQAQLAGLKRPIPLALVRQQLANQLQQQGSPGGFLTGALTFCALLPMRSLPFRWVCVLGLDDGALPRQISGVGFDLMRRHPQPGDRSVRLDDRYLFLETLLSAQDGLYLSYVGHDARDNSELPPSVLVSELLQVVDATAVAADGRPVSAHIQFAHPMQPFAAGNFGQGPQRGFAALWHQGAEQLARPATRPAPWFDQTLPAPKVQTIETAQLLRCLVHPARYLLQQRLGLKLPIQPEALAEDEPFAIDRKAEKHLRQLALTAYAQNWEPDAEQRLASFAGLPAGAIGQAAWQNLRGPIRHFARQLASEQPKPLPSPLTVAITLGDTPIQGWLDGVSTEGLFGYRLNGLSNWDLVPFWLRHLLLNLAAPAGIACHSRLLAPDRQWQLEPVDNAAELLEPWLAAYRQALQAPLPLFTRSSWAYVQRWQRDKTCALNAARNEWRGNDHHPGEGQDPWNALAFRDLDPIDEHFTALAEQLYGPLGNALKDTAS